MARGNTLGKSFVLLILIIILALAGLMWFDFLGVIHAKTVFSPVYRMLHLQPQTSVSSSSSKPLTADLDQDRLDKQREALDIYREELDKREEDVSLIEKQNEQIAQELENREKSLEDREKTFNNAVKQHDDIDRNIEQIAANLEGMQPKSAVSILTELDDQMAIDVLRKVDERAQAAGTSSMVAYWLSLMPADHAARLQRKSASKPTSLD